MRKKIIAGNWKMNKTISEALELVRKLCTNLKDCNAADVVVCPPFCSLSAVGQELAGAPIALGAQNLFWEAKGAFTGEVSAGMLKDVDCTYVILGHSERRHIFKETSEQVNKKIKAALKAGLLPIVCVGELLEERKTNRTREVIEEQLQGSLSGICSDEMQSIIIAYEPVWAIGTGQTATPEQAQDVHSFIRGWIAGHFGKETAEVLRIQYGGSVTPENSAALLGQADIDGALVGGASLNPESFLAIIQSACNC